MQTERGFTIMELLIVLAIIGFIMGVRVVPSLMGSTVEARLRQTRIEETAIVGAHQRWTWDDPDPCPTALAALQPYAGRRHMNDPWGTAYEMFCGATAPTTADFGVLSHAQDRTRGTTDDIPSWTADED
jgi:prepilin-type N-terminal cleavage/methylation domain-containing protein